ncbi:type I secretion system permease/ATPase [Pseudooceanicola algae]|uniref:Type I secretion system ATP-binding protein PrsD n=1 Tax=Pseudooceanicola algae TaxID=1537215 RepID=A0A418SHH3_9RHOB|nr:type I secretion system permease/ATPase [Pseudooceanicola algae]QPM90505.1 Type I secretion system ATP-binding protein PrsD [Pseudooceanicola algae]
MTRSQADGRSELRDARRLGRGLFWAAGLFSCFVNLLMLTGPLYMMQVYDRVLNSGSVETLVALTLLAAFLYAIMAALDFARSRLMARAGARFQAALDERVFRAMIRRSAVARDPAAETGRADLESIQKLIGSPLASAAFDLPWTPVFLFGIALFHPWLGTLAISGGLLLVVVALLNQLLTSRPRREAAVAAHGEALLAEEIRTEAGMIQSMGMLGAAFSRWVVARDAALASGVNATEKGSGFSALTKALRMFLQSAMLGLGALLALKGELSPGAMIAGSILLGRALAPIEVGLGQWSLAQRARRGWVSLADLLTRVPPEAEPMPLPRPDARLEVEGLALRVPGVNRSLLRGVSLSVAGGQAVGVIGPSGAGKSTLALALTGAVVPAAGTVRLGGPTLGQYGPDALGQHVGYLPQRVRLFDGTIGQNIARLEIGPDPEKIVAAAKLAAAHELIVNLPDGYDTAVGPDGAGLSGGQLQRIALARALYGDPVVVILDEPNSNLDSEGNNALNAAIRSLKEAGRIVILMAHRPAAIRECDLLLFLENGAQVAFGPRDEILQKFTGGQAAQATPRAVKGGKPT